jgi:ABC-type lipoprotein release transport system permease subunit
MMILAMAWRNIWRNKMRSIVIMLSISLGLFAGIAVLALYKGMMTARIRTSIDAEVGHLQVHDTSFKKDFEPQYIIANGNELLNRISAMPGVKIAAPRSITNGMLANATGSAGVQLNGIIPEKEYIASQLREKLIDGKLFNAKKKNEVMIGKKLADKLKLKTGSKVVLTFTDTSAGIVSGAFRVAGIYQSANAPLDERNVYLNMPDMNALLGTGNAFHEIVVLLKNDEELPAVKAALRRSFPNYKIESWQEIAPETDLMIKTTDRLSYILMSIIMFALAFGIINTMLMAILERTREIGMMVALGTTKLKIFLLVLVETVFLTLAGAPIGILAGWLAANYYNRNGLDLSGMGKEMMSSFGYSTVIYPAFPADKFTGVLVIVFATAIISCLFPAVKVLRLQPVDALRR